MNSITESPAILTIHSGSQGQFILRVSDMKYRPLIVGVTKLLPEARSFVLVTPSDIKVFNVGEETEEEVSEEIKDLPPAELPQQETPEEPVSTVRRRGRPPKDKQAGHDEPCQRCSGTGMTKVIMDGGAGAETTCPICQGTGQMRRYGARR